MPSVHSGQYLDHLYWPIFSRLWYAQSTPVSPLSHKGIPSLQYLLPHQNVHILVTILLGFPLRHYIYKKCSHNSRNLSSYGFPLRTIQVSNTPRNTHFNVYTFLCTAFTYIIGIGLSDE